MNRDLPAVTVYGDVILWERPIQIVAADWLKPGSTVLDVGANTGGLAIAFSRLVGPRGKVLGFEANPRMAAWAKRDIQANGATVEIVPFAAYSTSGEVLSFYCDASYYAASSSLVRPGIGEEIKVRTVAIDDLVQDRVLRPALIKIDVEGAEPKVLEGAKRTLAELRPTVVFEYSGQADTPSNPIRMMEAAGYDLYDVNTYELVTLAYFAQPYSTNVVAIPKDGGKHYVRSVRDATTEVVDSQTIRIALSAGRTVLPCRIFAEGHGGGAITAHLSDGTMIALYCADIRHLQHHACSSLVVDLPSADEVTIRIEAREVGLLVKLDRVEAWAVDLMAT